MCILYAKRNMFDISSSDTVYSAEMSLQTLTHAHSARQFMLEMEGHTPPAHRIQRFSIFEWEKQQQQPKIQISYMFLHGNGPDIQSNELIDLIDFTLNRNWYMRVENVANSIIIFFSFFLRFSFDFTSISIQLIECVYALWSVSKKTTTMKMTTTLTDGNENQRFV